MHDITHKKLSLFSSFGFRSNHSSFETKNSSCACSTQLRPSIKKHNEATRYYKVLESKNLNSFSLSLSLSLSLCKKILLMTFVRDEAATTTTTTFCLVRSEISLGGSCCSSPENRASYHTYLYTVGRFSGSSSSGSSFVRMYVCMCVYVRMLVCTIYLD